MVTGERASALVGIAPIATFDAKFIESTGSSSMAELLRIIAPMARSADGADPIILLNGQRTSGWEEIQSLPPEALTGTEILPESAAIRYGYPPTRRLLNFTTKARFRAIDLSAYGGASTAGGVATRGGNAGLTQIDGRRRLTLAVNYDHADPLSTSHRPFFLDPDNLFDPVGNVVSATGMTIDPALDARAGRPVFATAVPADAAARSSLAAYLPIAGQLNIFDVRPSNTLTDRIDTVKGNAVLKLPLATGTDATFTLSSDRSWKSSRQGYPALTIFVPATSSFSPFARDVFLYRFVPDRIMKQHVVSTNLHAGAALQGGFHAWQWDLTGALDQNGNANRGDRGYGPLAIGSALAQGADPFADLQSLLGPRLSQRSTVLNRKAELKAVARGTLAHLPAGDLSLVATGEGGWVQTHTRSRGYIDNDFSLHQSRVEGGATIDVPIASRREDALPFLGELSVSLTGRVRAVQGYDVLHDTTAGLNWTPLKRLQLSVTRNETQSPANLDYRSAATVQTQNVPFFDFNTGRNVYVTLITGGNPGLAPERKRELTYGFTWKPFDQRQLTIGGSYNATLIRDGSIVVSALTPRTEGELPEQFIRDPFGRLDTVILRPFNADRERQRTLKLDLNVNGPIGKQVPASKGRDARNPGFYYAGIASVFTLRDRLQLRPGFTAYDLPAGDTVDGSRYHYRAALWAWAGVNRSGNGLNLNAQYLGAARISGGAPQADLAFAPLFTLDASVYTWLRTWWPHADWLNKTKITLQVTNLFDSYQHVQNGAGTTPFRYQRYLLDPTGRSVKITLRKLFQ